MSETYIPNAYKLVLGRNRTRIVAYENLRLQTTQPIKEEKPKKIKPSIPSDYADHNYYNRMKQRRETIRELAYNNFDPEFSMMVTLTFADQDGKDFTSLDEAHHQFKTFIQRMQTHFDNFEYIATFNRQNNQKWHYHLLTNLIHTTKTRDIQKIWNNGIVHITKIIQKDLFDTSVQYLISNMTSSANDTKGKHGYLASKNLERNIIIKSYKQEDFDKFQEVFEEIRKQPYKTLYETKNHLGIQGKNVNEETGEVFNVTIPDRELDEMLKNAGYESWDSIFTYVSSPVHFKDLFKPILPATPKPKSRRKRKNGKNLFTQNDIGKYRREPGDS